jgi:hypothetical protein
MEIMRDDPLINDPLRQPGDDEVRRNDDKEQDQCDGGPDAIRSQKSMKA